MTRTMTNDANYAKVVENPVTGERAPERRRERREGGREPGDGRARTRAWVTFSKRAAEAASEAGDGEVLEFELALAPRATAVAHPSVRTSTRAKKNASR